MADTPEAKVKKTIRKLLKARGVYYEQLIGTHFGAQALDFTCCYRGKFFAIEAKAPGKDLTALQQAIKRRIETAGGKVFKVSNNNELLEVDFWIHGL